MQSLVQIVVKIRLVFTVCQTLGKVPECVNLLIPTTVLFAAEEAVTERLSQCYLQCNKSQ